MSHPCGMMPRFLFGSTEQCGKLATVGYKDSIGEGLVPMCDDCIAWSGTQRRYLKKLHDSTTDTTTPKVKTEASDAK